MTRASPELLAVARRWYQAILSRDAGRIRAFVSKDPAEGFIGSARGETWFGPAVRQAIGDHFREIPLVQSWREISARAYENG